MTDGGQGVTIQEAQKITGLSARTLRRYVKLGKLTVTRSQCKFGQQILFSEAELRALPAPGSGETPRQVAGALAGRDSPLDSNPLKDHPLVAKLEAATYRIGWLEGQLDMTQKALTEGADSIRQREESLEKARAEVLELDRYLQDERARRQALEARVRELERPWWQKLFRPSTATAIP
jgi:DNA-binding transcriptional MerR regulator